MVQSHMLGTQKMVVMMTMIQQHPHVIYVDKASMIYYPSK